jgi:hypothetical protein
MLVNLSERVRLMVRVSVDYVITDNDTGKTFSSIGLTTCDGVGMSYLIDVVGLSEGSVGRVARYNDRWCADPLGIEDCRYFVIPIGVFILNHNHRLEFSVSHYIEDSFNWSRNCLPGKMWREKAV